MYYLSIPLFHNMSLEFVSQSIVLFDSKYYPNTKIIGFFMLEIEDRIAEEAMYCTFFL